MSDNKRLRQERTLDENIKNWFENNSSDEESFWDDTDIYKSNDTENTKNKEDRLYIKLVIGTN